MDKPIRIRHLSVVNLNSYERSPVLIADFKNGFTTGWRFKLPSFYKSALDIKQTSRAVQKKAHRTWTQGTAFSFKTGDLIYDTSLAYKLPWDKALKIIRFAIRITNATQDSILESDQILTTVNGEETIIHFNKFFDGTVEFELLKSTGSDLEIYSVYNTTQTEFVRFLQQGLMTTLDEEKINLEDIFVSAFPNVIPISNKTER